MRRQPLIKKVAKTASVIFSVAVLAAGLLAWRIYTNGLGVVLGIVLAAHVYGWPALRRLARRWSDPD